MNQDPARRLLLAPCLALLAAACGQEAPELRAATAAATAGAPARLVKDLWPGSAPQGSLPESFVVAGGIAYFTADDGSSGRELWRSDGTAAGTRLLTDLLPGGGSSAPAHLAALGSVVLFAADDGARGRELWRTDGTAAGTALLKDIRPGNRGSNPRHLTAVGAQVFFVAETAANGAELWKTDGTEAGTVLVRDIAASPTPEVGSDPDGLVAVGGTLFFAAHDGVYGRELWKSDGTMAGTLLVRDIEPGGSSSPTLLTSWSGRVWFAAETPAAAGAVQLWMSDGTADGTTVVGGDVAALTNPIAPSLLTPFGTALHYRAFHDGEWSLWSTTGSTQTRLTTGLDPSELAASGPRLLLSATRAAEGRELFAWNGAILSLVADILPGAGSSDPARLTDVGGVLFFRATGPMDGAPRLWRSDGTPAGTGAVFASGGPEVGEIATLGALALFSGSDATGAEPWRSDGTEAGSARIANLRPDVAGSEPRDLAIWSGDGRSTSAPTTASRGGSSSGATGPRPGRRSPGTSTSGRARRRTWGISWTPVRPSPADRPPAAGSSSAPSTPWTAGSSGGGTA